MIDRGLRDDFLGWFDTHARAALTTPPSPARNPRMTEVVEVPGDPELSAQACSIAFQAEFDSLDAAHRYGAEVLAPVAEAYIRRFGRERALIFGTILKSLD